MLTKPDIDTFLDSYIECALWSSTDSDGEPLDSVEHCDREWDADSLAKMRSDCEKFLEFCSRIELPEDAKITHRPLVVMLAHDFWLTRNGHGAGFWDGGWEEPWATRLTHASEQFGEVNIYIGDDGKFYI